jgi:Tol biopolymer transport system component
MVTRLRLVGACAVTLLLAGGASTNAASSSGAFRILYTSDWSGTTEIYAADPSGAHPVAQLTFGRAPTCSQAGCGYSVLGQSPDGRFILYSDFSACSLSQTRSSIFVARADGSHVRVLARAAAPSDCPFGLQASWSPDSKQIAYLDGGLVRVVDLDSGHNRVVGEGNRVSWAPTSTALAFSALTPAGRYGPLSVRMNGRTRVLAVAASDFEWSPDGRLLAYSHTDATYENQTVFVHPDGSRGRVIAGAELQPSGWSPDSRFLTVSTPNGIAVVRVGDGSVAPLGFSAALAWQPRGHVLAVTDERGTFVLDVANGASRLLTSEQAAGGVWSPDGRSFAYIGRSSPSYFGASDLRVVTQAGATRTLVRGDGPFGGSFGGVVWTRVPRGARYRPARPRALPLVGDESVIAPWPIDRLGTDGGRVAFASCGHVFVWTPADRSLVQAEATSSLSPRCTTPGNYWALRLYTLALSGDRIAYGYVNGNAGQSWELYTGLIGDGGSFTTLAGVASSNGCAVGGGGLGDLTGGGGLLVYSTWRDDLHCPARTLEQEIYRVDGGVCPCSVIATSPGPLVPFDADGDRIVAGGENATVVYDAFGTQLVSVPVSPLAAQLSGSDLVILVQGELLVYDVATGVQQHAWPMPGVPSGGECASPHYGTWECRSPRLILEDAASGLATYVLNGQVHLLRLASGADATVGAGTLARFTDVGLVYADGANLHLVGFDRLPLRG